jgi:hypothetical protein
LIAQNFKNSFRLSRSDKRALSPLFLVSIFFLNLQEPPPLPRETRTKTNERTDKQLEITTRKTNNKKQSKKTARTATTTTTAIPSSLCRRVKTIEKKQEERQESSSSKTSNLPRRQMKTKELSKRKRDNTHHREKNLTEETRDEREEKSFFLLLGRKTQNRNRPEVGNVLLPNTHREARLCVLFIAYKNGTPCISSSSSRLELR